MLDFKLENENEYSQKSIDEIMNDCEYYRKDLIKYCSQFFKNEYEYAEDCVQEAYLALYESLHKGKEISNYQAWLKKVVSNHKNKVIKDKIKRKENNFNDSQKKEDAINNALIYEPNYIDELIFNETDTISDEAIRKQKTLILSKLNKNEQRLYYLRYHDKKLLKEIAEELGITYVAARKRHSDLKRKIIRLTKEYNK